MGIACSHMNIWALGCIIREPADIVDRIYTAYEQKYVIDWLEKFEMQLVDLHSVLLDFNVHESDMDIIEDAFRLLDHRSRGIANVRDAMISICPMIASSISHMFSLAFTIIDREKTNMIEKHDLLLIIKLCSDTCANVGDRLLPPEILRDYVDSIYTSAGRIDGIIYYPDYLEALSSHPIVQLYISPQMQGSITSKLMTDVQIDELYGT